MKVCTTFLLTAVIFLMMSCGGDSYPTHKKTIEAGKQLFEKNCSSCHSFLQDGIGPSLSGVTTRLSPEYLRRFILNPKEMRDSVTTMPPFSFLKDDEIRSITAYLNTHNEPAIQPLGNADTIGDPIPEKIGLSGITAALIPVCQFPATSQKEAMPLTRITKLGYAPAVKGYFVNDLRGFLYKVDEGKPAVYLSIRGHFPRFISEPGLATGFGSFAFHPDFIHNGLLYTSHTESPGFVEADFTFEDSLPRKLQWVITEWKTNEPQGKSFRGTKRELLRIDMVAEAHGMQELTFRPSAKKGDDDFGFLYIGIGDGASIQLGFPFVADGRDRVWGSVLRIDPSGKNSGNKQYGIPETNPFFRDTASNTVREMFAHGFRNPHRVTWTPEGELLVSNIGQANIEALYKLKGGENCGWPVREGGFEFRPYGNLNHLYALPAKDSTRYTYPVIQYDHDEGKAISGGYFYQFNAIPSFKGKFVFGDIPTGRLFISDLDKKTIAEWNVSINGKATTLKDLCGSDRVDLHFGMDEADNLYIMTKADGKLYRVVSN